MWSDFTTINYPLISKKNIISNNLLIKKMKQERKIIKSLPNVVYTITNKIITTNIIDRLSSTTWVHKEGVLNSIHILDIQVKISWNNNIIYLKTTTDKYNKILKRLPIFLKMINYLIGDSKKKVIIYLILSNLKKKCIKGENISAEHVNSGYSDMYNNIIFIWREEEFEKVTFHELIHFYDKDHRHEIYDNPNKSYYESLTDTKAIYYNIIYLSIITKIKLKVLLNLEINFLNNQAIYINEHLNYSDEVSPAFAYYILKSKIFNYLLSNQINEKIYTDIFNDHINGHKLLKIIINNELHNINYYNFESARMTFLELA